MLSTSTYTLYYFPNKIFLSRTVFCSKICMYMFVDLLGKNIFEDDLKLILNQLPECLNRSLGWIQFNHVHVNKYFCLIEVCYLHMYIVLCGDRAKHFWVCMDNSGKPDVRDQYWKYFRGKKLTKMIDFDSKRKKNVHNTGFQENWHFCRKLAKIAENNDQ
jgi:hypothetical protein